MRVMGQKVTPPPLIYIYVLDWLFQLNHIMFIWIIVHPPFLRPSCCQGQFCQRHVELAPPPYSHAQTGVYSEKHQEQQNNKSMNQ